MVTLSRRFSAGFILILALPSLLISVLLARLYLAALYQTVAQQAEATAEQVAQNIHGETDNVAILLAALLYDGDLRQSVEQCGEATDRRVRYQEGHRIDQKLTSFFNYTKEVGAVVLRAKNGARYSCSNYPNLRGLAGMDRSVIAGAAADPGKVFLLDTLEGVTTNIGEKNLVTLAVCPAPTDRTAIESILVCFLCPPSMAWPGTGGRPPIRPWSSSAAPASRSCAASPAPARGNWPPWRGWRGVRRWPPGTGGCARCGLAGGSGSPPCRPWTAPAGPW